jgi:hypothetical protein
MSATMIDDELLQREVARLRSEGLDVFLQPSNAPAPAFMGDFVPDAVAFGNGRKIVVEVVRNPSDKRLADLAAEVQKQREWEFKKAANRHVSNLYGIEQDARRERCKHLLARSLLRLS